MPFELSRLDLKLDPKGQLISKCLFFVSSISSKKPNKWIRFYYYASGFLVEIEDTQKKAFGN